jgi:hypothetical protein
MANPFSSVTVTGYNTSPPPDDGSTTASNEITWSGIKGKIGDPLKTAFDAINTNALAAFGKQFGYNIESVATDLTLGASDTNKFIPTTGTHTITLPAAATAGSSTLYAVFNNGTGTTTLDGNGSETINGATTLVLEAGEWAILACDGSAWTALRSFSPNALATKATPTTADSIVIMDAAASNVAKTATIPAVVGALFSPITNSLSADVTLNNTASYFTGPTVAQGTTGTWFASGTMKVTGTAGDSIFAKLWDGTTVIASVSSQIPTGGTPLVISLSGFLASPAANIKISVKNGTSTTASVISHSDSDNSKNATLTAFRIA